MQNAIDEVQVGKARVSLAKARRWIEEYTAEANSTASDPYAFPAYDRYNRELDDPARLSDADLLAPGLLNVPVKIRTFYELQRVRGELEAALDNPDLDLDLAMIDDDERVAAMVRPLYAVLDDPATRPQGARATTLSKVLHRKRPKSIVLHDQRVRACYWNTERVKPVKGRKTADYMCAITSAIARDIRSQQAVFDELSQVSNGARELSHVRLLDILAWQAGKSGV